MEIGRESRYCFVRCSLGALPCELLLSQACRHSDLCLLTGTLVFVFKAEMAFPPPSPNYPPAEMD